jgi:hypothetical protein
MHLAGVFTALVAIKIIAKIKGIKAEIERMKGLD